MISLDDEACSVQDAAELLRRGRDGQTGDPEAEPPEREYGHRRPASGRSVEQRLQRRSGDAGNIPPTTPSRRSNYVSAHDDLNLYDKVAYSGGTGGASGRAGQIDTFAAGLVLASQGIPFISEGDEFLHSKVVNGDYGTAMNSYTASDAVNAMHWGDKVTNAAIYTYYRDAIAVRKASPALRLTTWGAVHNQEATTVSGSVIVARISSSSANPTSYDTVVVANPGSSSYAVTLPAGTWTRVLDSTGAVSSTSTTAAGRTVSIFKKN